MHFKPLRSLTLISSFLLLTACHSIPLDQNDANQQAGNMNASGSTQGISNDAANTASNNLEDPNNPLSPFNKQSVYFGFDQYTVSDEYQPLLRRYVQFMQTHPNRHIIIQGNTDNRGSSEYNLALGQKRANAVQQALNVLGVSNQQMQAVSFGKEKPAAIGDNEAAWAQNRRADIVYQP